MSGNAKIIIVLFVRLEVLGYFCSRRFYSRQVVLLYIQKLRPLYSKSHLPAVAGGDMVVRNSPPLVEETMQL